MPPSALDRMLASCPDGAGWRPAVMRGRDATIDISGGNEMGTTLGLGVGLVEVLRASAAWDGESHPVPSAGALRSVAEAARRAVEAAAGWLGVSRPAAAPHIGA